jgi:hypothetical protein
MSFLKEFESKYSQLLDYKINWQKRKCLPNLHQRSEGFRLIFSLLEKLKKDNYQIVETGVLRKLGNWRDGQSSLLFQEFLKYYSGTLKSVDINEDNCAEARKYLDSSIVNVTCSDSVEFLKSVDKTNIDCYFLDSYDVSWQNCEPSAFHHLKEFKTIEPFLKSGTIVAIDDNTFYDGVRSGKGTLIFNYLKEKGILPLYDEYMIIYQWK